MSRLSEYRKLTCLTLCSFGFQRKQAFVVQLLINSGLLSENGRHIQLDFLRTHLETRTLFSPIDSESHAYNYCSIKVNEKIVAEQTVDCTFV